MLLGVPFMIACTGGQAQDRMPAHPGLESRQNTAVPGEFLVTLYDGKTQADLSAALSAFTVRAIANVSGAVFLVKLPEQVTVEELEKKAKGSKVIKSIQQNMIYRTNHKKGGPF